MLDLFFVLHSVERMRTLAFFLPLVKKLVKFVFELFARLLRLAHQIVDAALLFDYGFFALKCCFIEAFSALLFAVFAFRSASENFSDFFPSVKSFFEFAFSSFSLAFLFGCYLVI